MTASTNSEHAIAMTPPTGLELADRLFRIRDELRLLCAALPEIEGDRQAMAGAQSLSFRLADELTEVGADLMPKEPKQ